VRIEILNWDRFNIRKDVKATSWLRFQNNFCIDPDFWNFNPEERMVWIYILCESSQRYKQEISIEIEQISAIMRLNIKNVRSGIEKLVQLGAIKDISRPCNVAVPSESNLASATNRRNKQNKQTEQTDKAGNTATALDILNYWNYQNIIVHKPKPELLEKVFKAYRKKKRDLCEVKKGIDNYTSILTSNKYLWTHEWGLVEFLSRDNADKFYPDEFSVGRFPLVNTSSAQQKQNKMLNMLRENEGEI